MNLGNYQQQEENMKMRHSSRLIPRLWTPVAAIVLTPGGKKRFGKWAL